MAAVTLGVSTADTTGSPRITGAFTPAAGDLLVVFAAGSATVDTAPTCISSVGGKTFTRILTQQQAATHSIAVFVADQGASAVSQTVTVDWPSDATSGDCIVVLRVSGMSLFGAAAVRQSAGGENGGAGSTPAVTFPGACLTGNVVALGARGNQNPLNVTPPTSYTEHADIGHASPLQGFEVCSRNSGETGTTITWGSAPGVANSVIGLELDTTVPAVQLPYRNPYPQLLAQ